jgi:hypothetical protein
MTALLAWERLGGKIADRHLERLAVVYVRQSTRQQVADHGESTRLQYGLVERAVTLGWPTSRVLVIDEDLGKSGASAAGRVGFQRLVTEITMGTWGWCWASRCRGWPARAPTGTSCWSCARWRVRCWPTPTASTTRWTTTTGCCWA